ncbi:MAG: germination protein YpeB, partial [Clostridia bacterium]|nr:germination protein YpeB [Clostridia bacterium]
MAIIHALGVGAIVGLSVALHFSQQKLERQMTYQNQMESVYSRAYYSLLDGVNDMDATLHKLTVARSREKQEALLYDIWCSSTLAEEYLATFGNNDEGIRTAVKFVNQLGDYSLHLASKLSRGEQLTEKDRNTLEK